MPSVVNSAEGIVGSIINALTSIFTGILAIFQHILNIFIGIFQTTFAAVGTAIGGLAQTFQGLLKFIFSNFLIIGVFVAAIFLYGAYQQRAAGTGRVGTQKKTI